MLTKYIKEKNLTKVNIKDQDKKTITILYILISFCPQIMDVLELLVFY